MWKRTDSISNRLGRQFGNTAVFQIRRNAGVTTVRRLDMHLLECRGQSGNSALDMECVCDISNRVCNIQNRVCDYNNIDKYVNNSELRRLQNTRQYILQKCVLPVPSTLSKLLSLVRYSSKYLVKSPVGSHREESWPHSSGYSYFSLLITLTAVFFCRSVQRMHFVLSASGSIPVNKRIIYFSLFVIKYKFD